MTILRDFRPLLPGIEYTLLVTAGAYSFAVIVALPLTALRRSRFALLRMVSRMFTEIVRSIPVITWLFIIFFGLAEGASVRLTPLVAAILGLGLIYAAYLTEVFRAGLLAVHRGQWEAARAVGMSERDVMLRVVGPQALRVVIPPAATFALGLLKDSAIASTIGVAEITFRASFETQRTFDGLTFFMIAGVLYILLSLPLAVAARRIDRSLRHRLRAEAM